MILVEECEQRFRRARLNYIHAEIKRPLISNDKYWSGPIKLFVAFNTDKIKLECVWILDKEVS